MRKALIIDDSRTIRLILGRILYRLGFDSQEAGNGRDALQQLKAASGEEFESLLMTHLLKSARESGGWLGSGEDQSMGSMIEFAEEQLAKVLVSQGGLGLTRMVSESLGRVEQPAKTSDPSADKDSR